MMLHGFWQGLQAASENLYAGECVNDEVRTSFFAHIQSTSFLVAQSIAAAVACVLLFVSPIEKFQTIVGVFLLIEFAAILVISFFVREVSSRERKDYYENVRLDQQTRDTNLDAGIEKYTLTLRDDWEQMKNADHDKFAVKSVLIMQFFVVMHFAIAFFSFQLITMYADFSGTPSPFLSTNSDGTKHKNFLAVGALICMVASLLAFLFTSACRRKYPAESN